MTCDDCRARLLRYLHDELPSSRPVEGHLRSCVNCRLHFQVEEKLWDALGGFQVDLPNCDLASGLHHSLERRARRIRFAQLAAAAVVLAAIGAGLVFRPAAAPIRPTRSEPLAVYREDSLMDQHPAEAPHRFPYIDGYDRAVAEGHYISFVAAESEVPQLIQSDRRSGMTHDLYSTPRGTISVFIEDRSGVSEERLTVLRAGREFKILSVSRGGRLLTFVSDRLPWPEIRLFAQDFERDGP